MVAAEESAEIRLIPNATAVIVPPARRTFAERLAAASLPANPQTDKTVATTGMSIATSLGKASTNPSAKTSPPTSAMGIWKPAAPTHSSATPAIAHTAPNTMRGTLPLCVLSFAFASLPSSYCAAPSNAWIGGMRVAWRTVAHAANTVAATVSSSVPASRSGLAANPPNA